MLPKRRRFGEREILRVRHVAGQCASRIPCQAGKRSVGGKRQGHVCARVHGSCKCISYNVRSSRIQHGHMIEFVLRAIGYVLLQMLGDALMQLGFSAFAEPLQKPPRPWLAALGYLLFGFIAGAISLAIVSSSLMPAEWHFAGLLAAPVLFGVVVCAASAWRARGERALLRGDRFIYACMSGLDGPCCVSGSRSKGAGDGHPRTRLPVRQAACRSA